MLILPFSLSGMPGNASRKRMIRSEAAAFSARSRFNPSSLSAIHLETLTPALAASMRTHRSVVSSMLIVTFCMSRIS